MGYYYSQEQKEKRQGRVIFLQRLGTIITLFLIIDVELVIRLKVNE